MAITLLDSFSGGDAATLGANWTADLGGYGWTSLHVVSGQAARGDSAYESNWWNASTFGPNCEIYCTIKTLPSNTARLYARLQNPGTTATFSGYELEFSGGANSYIIRNDPGEVRTAICTLYNTNFTADDKVMLRCEGNVLSGWADRGSGWELVGMVYDSTYTGAGYVGLWSQNNATFAVDDLYAGTMDAPVSFPVTPIIDDFASAGTSKPPAGWTNVVETGDTSLQGDGAGALRLDSGGSGNGSAYRTLPLSGADHEVYVKVPVIPTADTNNVGVFFALASPGSAAPTGYAFHWWNRTATDDFFELYRVASGNDNGFDTDTQRLVYLPGYTLAAGDSIGARRTGNDIELWHKPAAGAWVRLLTYTDATYVPTAPYIGVDLREGVARLDDFGGGSGKKQSLGLLGVG